MATKRLKLIRRFYLIAPCALLFLCLACSLVSAQPAITFEEEEKRFYENFALSSFSKQVMREELLSYYDLFGEHITDGFYIYGLTNDRNFVTTTTISDSTLSAASNEFRKRSFYENFNNLIMTRDAVGGVKIAFLIGSQLRTRFSPLTFSKKYYEGIRWDLYSSGLGLSALFSRTRPGLHAFRRYFSGVQEDQFVTDSWATFPIFGITVDQVGDEFVTSDRVDFSAKSVYGDYDLLWGFHAQKEIFDNLNIGLNYINHHHSDVKKGEKWNGDLPDALAPNEIHFELYDITSQNTFDPGVRLHQVTMSINGGAPLQPKAVYRGTPTGLLKISDTQTWPYVQNGTYPLIVTFFPKESTGPDSLNIKDIEFNFDIEGNYLIFVGTDRIGPLNKQHFSDPLVGYHMKLIADLEGITPDDPKNAEVYFGDYILKTDGVVADYTNRRLAKYHYRIPTSRITYGITFDGNLKGVKIKGEIAANVKRSKYPTSKGEVKSLLNNAAYLTLERALTSNLILQSKMFNMDSDYQTNLATFQVSRYYFSQPASAGNKARIHLNSYPIILGNYFNSIDDNDDDDFYVDGEASIHPAELSDLNANTGAFYNDGYRKNPARLALPSADSTYSVIYDDRDGVILDRFDRNKGGGVDYEEDFLIYFADPPVFDLELDVNNNAVFDVFEDDLYPDFPFQVSYVLTSNGYRSTGIRGLDLELIYTPVRNLTLTFGSDYLRALDPDLDRNEEALDTDEGKSRQIYGLARYRLSLRDLGINFFFGEELKGVQDAIRNHTVETRGRTNYGFITDNLRFRNALVSNTVGVLNYLGIPQFEFNTKLALRVEKHFKKSEKMYLTRSLFDKQDRKTFYFRSLSDYKSIVVGSMDYLIKMAYTISFYDMAERLPWYLRFIQKLKINPQYKFMYRIGISDLDDPREGGIGGKYHEFVPLDNPLARDNLNNWLEYSELNGQSILTVPIIRISYPLGDKTSLEYGIQWKRQYDLLIPENSLNRRVSALQLMSKDNYSGYNISVRVGWVFNKEINDINEYHSLYRYGNTWNTMNNSIFIEIFAGF